MDNLTRKESIVQYISSENCTKKVNLFNNNDKNLPLLDGKSSKIPIVKVRSHEIHGFDQGGFHELGVKSHKDKKHQIKAPFVTSSSVGQTSLEPFMSSNPSLEGCTCWNDSQIHECECTGQVINFIPENLPSQLSKM